MGIWQIWPLDGPKSGPIFFSRGTKIYPPEKWPERGPKHGRSYFSRHLGLRRSRFGEKLDFRGHFFYQKKFLADAWNFFLKVHPKTRLLRPRWLHMDENWWNKIDQLISHRGKFGVIAPNRLQKPWQMIWRDLFVFAGLLFKSKAPQNLLRASVCGSKLRIRCCVLLCLDLTLARIGRRTSETTSLSPIWPKTVRRILRPDSKQVGDSRDVGTCF